MANRTVNDLVRAVLRKNGVYNPAETPTAADTSTTLEAIQDLLAEWSGEGLMVPAVTQESFTLIPGQATYTVGKEGSPTLNTVRPVQITSFFVRDHGNYDFVGRIIGERGYNQLLAKFNLRGRPDRLWPQFTVPNVTFHVYPVPVVAESLHFSAIKPFNEPTELVEDLLNTTEIPREFYTALMWNVACDIAPEFTKEPTQYMLRRAELTKTRVWSSNLAVRIEPARLEIAERRRPYSPAIGDALED